VQEFQVNANGLLVLFQWFVFHFTGKYDVPLVALSLDGAGFDRAFDCSMQLDFDAPNLRERDATLMREGKTCLGIGEAIKMSFAFIAWKPRCVTTLASGEERLKCLLLTD
jgi:hypothetical protein